MTAFCSLQGTRVHSPAPTWDRSQSPAASAPGIRHVAGTQTLIWIKLKIKNGKLVFMKQDIHVSYSIKQSHSARHGSPHLSSQHWTLRTGAINMRPAWAAQGVPGQPEHLSRSHLKITIPIIPQGGDFQECSFGKHLALGPIPSECFTPHRFDNYRLLPNGSLGANDPHCGFV